MLEKDFINICGMKERKKKKHSGAADNGFFSMRKLRGTFHHGIRTPVYTNPSEARNWKSEKEQVFVWTEKNITKWDDWKGTKGGREETSWSRLVAGLDLKL